MNIHQVNGNERLRRLINDCLLVRKQTTDICARISLEDHVVQPIADVSPPKWHLAHTTWFFEELILLRFASSYERLNQQYQLLFNSYYKSAGQHWLQAHRGNLSRPTVAEILHYRTYVDSALVDLSANVSANAELLSLLQIGLHHEQQHQELLLMDIKYILASNPHCPSYSDTQLVKAQPADDKWRNFNEGVYQLGSDGKHFAYDNEKPRHRSYIHPFSICEKTVTNGDFLEFIIDKGYSAPRFWLSIGWDWLSINNIQQPLYWRQEGSVWYEYTLHGLQTLDLNAPVTHISYFEADAYANWRGMRLPTEQELEIYLSSAVKAGVNTAGIAEHTSMALTDVLQPYASDASTGQVWCWSKSHYSSYPGYQPYQGVLTEYNGKFMCNQFVLKGGCIATPKGHYRHSYRNFYAPQQRWMFSGIRLTKDI